MDATLWLVFAERLVSLAWFELAVAALPGTFAGAWLGRRLYARIADDRFNRLVLALLLLSGLSIVIGGLAQ